MAAKIYCHTGCKISTVMPPPHKRMLQRGEHTLMDQDIVRGALNVLCNLYIFLIKLVISVNKLFTTQKGPPNSYPLLSILLPSPLCSPPSPKGNPISLYIVRYWNIVHKDCNEIRASDRAVCELAKFQFISLSQNWFNNLFGFLNKLHLLGDVDGAS